MTVEIDVYQDCLCGSGKKLKFCCLPIAGDMIKIIRLQESGQAAAALTALEALEKKPIRASWSRAWIKSGKASLLGGYGKWAEAKPLVQEVLDEVPEHHFSRGLIGFIALQLDGYRAARPVLYEALQATAERLPLMASELAVAMGHQLLSSQHLFAAQQYFSVGLAFHPQSERNLELLRKFRESTILSYLLRGDYPLRPISGPEDTAMMAEFVAARRLFNLGCFNLAAQTFRKLARQNSHNAALWYNIGLCDASAGEEVLSVRAFREAAAAEPDFETAAEYSAIGQTLAWSSEVPQQRTLLHNFRAASFDGLVAKLDEQPEFFRVPDQKANGTNRVAFRLLDREWRNLSWDSLSIDEVPRDLAFISMEPDFVSGSTGAIVLALELEHQNLARPRLEEIAGSDIQFLDAPPTDQKHPEELAPFFVNLFFSEAISQPALVHLTKARWQQYTSEIWPGLKLSALGGKTPREAAADPELKTQLAGAALAFQAFLETRKAICDEQFLRDQVGLPPVAPLEIAADADTDQFSTPQLRRVALDKLTDEQFSRVSNRLMQLKHWAFDFACYKEVVTRPSMATKAQLVTMYVKLASLSSARLNYADALAWIDKAKEAARGAKLNITDLMSIEFQELALRAADPQDPQSLEIAHRLWEHYRPKLPEYRDSMLALFDKLKLKGPWNSPSATDEQAEALAGAGSEA